MEIVNSIIQVVTITISTVGALVVMWGVLQATWGFISLKVSPRGERPALESESVRQQLGDHLLLGLEIFIAADIISSVVSPTWDKVGILAAIVGIRTVLSYFLRMELGQTLRS